MPGAGYDVAAATSPAALASAAVFRYQEEGPEDLQREVPRPPPPFASQSVNTSTPTLATRDSQDQCVDKTSSSSSVSASASTVPTLINMSHSTGVEAPEAKTPARIRAESTEFSDVEMATGRGEGVDGNEPQTEEDESEKNFQPKTAKFWLIMLSNFVAMFLVALDRTIIATAIPRITDEFGSLGDIGWYGSAYMLTTAASQLLFGRIYKFYNLRWVFLGSIVIFEVGSTICGAAPNSPVFIAGRAIAGFGSAGIFTGAMMVMISIVPLHKRPVFQGIFGMVFGLSSVIGPLIGGGFTFTVTWRWCFYMNLPIGGAAFVLLFLFMEEPMREDEGPVSLKRQFMRLDPLGTLFFLPSIVSLLLALQWGGSMYAWNDQRIIALFVLFGVMFILFALVQIYMPKTATVPVKIITQRSMLAGSFFMFFLAGSMMLAIYYVPLWFQAVQSVDPVKSGIYTIPLVLSIVVSSILSGGGTQRIGYYVPSMLLCPCIMAVGLGLMSTWQPDTDSAHWIAYQFLTGFGLGFGMQTVGLAVQTVLPKEDVSTGIAISFFAQQLGAAIFISVGQTILSNLLVSELSHIPNVDAEMIVNSGATNLHRIVPDQFYAAVVMAYNYACTRIWLAATGLSTATLISALCMEWASIKKGKQGPPGPRKAPEEKDDQTEKEKVELQERLPSNDQQPPRVTAERNASL